MRKFIWSISERKSILHFKAKYFTIGHLSGNFKKIRGTVIAGAQFEDPEIELLISSSSVETLDAELNRKIRSAAILDAAVYPDLLFTSVGGCHVSSGVVLELAGNFQIKQHQFPVNLIVNFSDVKVKGKRTVASFHLFGELHLKANSPELLYGREFIETINLNAEIHLFRTSESP